MWRELGLPIKRLVLDEAQLVNKRDGERHKAVKRLFCSAILMLSGTFAHNVWHNMSGAVDFLQSHPFTSHKKFLRTFSSLTVDGRSGAPDIARMRLLQRFIQAIFIGRPSTLLALPTCHRVQIDFDLLPPHVDAVMMLTAKYLQSSAAARKEAKTDGLDSEMSPLAFAVEAQMLSSHPLLQETMKKAQAENKAQAEMVEAEIDNRFSDNADEQATEGEQRIRWLQSITTRTDLRRESARLDVLISIILHLNSAQRKILVFSTYLKFLDIVSESLHRHQLDSLRIDGTIKPNERRQMEKEFAQPHNARPLLITAQTGGVALNLTAASVVILAEEWWNSSTQNQALCRAVRQGQRKEVLAIQLHATNSAIDAEIARVRNKKSLVVSDLMRPLVRGPDEGPLILPLLHTGAIVA